MIVTTCMSRLQHLRCTLPLMAEHDEVVVCCYHDAVAARYVRELEHPRVRCVQVAGNGAFHKARALNVGADAAIRGGGVVLNAIDERVERLLFLDADTRIADPDAFEQWYSEAVQDPDHFHICLRDNEWYQSWDLSGVLLVSVEHFLASGGYEEAIRGWGIDDLELRMKLAIKCGLPWKNIPHELFKPIPHGDNLRVQNYGEKNKDRSNARNAQILARNIQAWTGGKRLQELDGKYRPLLSTIDRK